MIKEAEDDVRIPSAVRRTFVDVAVLLAVEYLAITVDLHVVRTATAHRASTHNTQRQDECMVLDMLTQRLRK